MSAPEPRGAWLALWTWLVPLVGAAAVFGYVLLTTPPGFESIGAVLFSPPRGLNGDASAYALGAAASLALLSLLVLAAACTGANVLRKRAKRTG